MSVERIGINGIFLLTGRVAEKAAQFMVLILAARSLSVEGYGAYSLSVYFTALCTILIDWGIQTFSIREVARDPSRTAIFFRHGIALKVLYALSAFGIVSVLLGLMHYPQLVWRAILIVFVGRVLLSFAQFNGALFRGHGKMHYEAVTAVGGVAVLVATTLIFLRFQYGVMGLAVSWLLYGLTEIGISSYLMSTYMLSQGTASHSTDLSLLQEMSKQSFVFGLCTVFTLIYFYLDTVLLSKMASLEIVSRYTAAYNVVIALVLVPQVLVDTLFPFFSQRYLRDGKPIGEFVGRVSRYFLLIVIPLGFGGSLLAAPLIRLVYGERYLGNALGADRALAILVWDGCLIFFTYLFGQVLAVFGKQLRVTRIAAVGALLNIALNFILIPRYSLIGAAAATVATEFVILLLLGWSLRSLSLFEKGSFPLAQPAIGTLCMGIFLWELRGLVSPVLCILCGMTVYGVSLAIVGELRSLRTMLAK